MISLLVFIVVVGLIVALLQMLPVDAKFKQIILWVGVVVVLLAVIQFFFGGGLPAVHWRM